MKYDNVKYNRNISLRKENWNMDIYLRDYLDRVIIDEYAQSEELSAYSDLPEHEQESLVLTLFSYDPVARDWLFDRMQQLIDARLIMKNNQNKYDLGLHPFHDDQTGETIWKKIA